MIWFVIFAVVVVAAILLMPSKNDKIGKSGNNNTVKTTWHYEWIVDEENVEKFYKAFKKDFEENDEYYRSAKELKEDYSDEKVYKYEPYELPLKMENKDVYSYIEDGEWVKIGRVKKTADIDGKLKLYLFPNTYKYVTEDSVEKETDDSYFGLKVIQLVENKKESQA